MSEDISPELFAHLVDLAALELKPEESEYLRKQMNNQLKSVNELVSIPLGADQVVASHGITYSPEISSKNRNDEWIAHLEPDKLLQQAPEIDNGYIIVPEIPHKELD
jgi:aspartyl-tRNA(Asn)/glutamyl-tRNA(Gln) amidotransferase subunit C